MSLSYLTINQVKQGLRNKDFSCQELVSYYLKRIEANQELNAYITVTDKQALKQAKVVDQKIKSGEQLKLLEGVPGSIKDIILTQGIKTTAGSKILANYIAPYDATVVKKLKELGVIILGKNNCDEFAMGASNENSAFGPVLNPWDKSRVPGGSSGGSAVAVAADLCTFSVGTDTGGSIRQPAALAGVVGLKPTYGQVSRYGLIAMTSSLDQAGPFTRTVEEAAQIFKIITSYNSHDATTITQRAKDYSPNLKDSIKDLKLGVAKEYFMKGIDPDVKNKVKEAIKEFEQLGVQVKEVSLPLTEYSLAVYYIIMPAEVSSNLARYDGIRYGQSSQVAKTLEELYQNSRADGFGAEVKRRIMIGTYVLSAGYQEAYYKQARRVQRLIQSEYQKIFKEVDALVTPTTPTPAFRLGEKLTDPLTMYLSDIYTVAANIAGLCGLSIPCGFSKEGLPIGLQLLGGPFTESTILKLGYHYQQVTKWHEKHPGA